MILKKRMLPAVSVAAAVALFAAAPRAQAPAAPPQRQSAVTPDPKAAAFATPAADNMTLTAVEGVKVGHFTLSERPTGCKTSSSKKGRRGVLTSVAARRARGRPIC